MLGLSGVVHRIEQEKALDQFSEPVAKWVSQVTKPDAIKYALSGSWLGHQLHPMASDIPLGAWLMASALDVTGGPTMRPAARRLVGLGVLSAIPAAASGASDWAESYGKQQRVGYVHALANGTGTILQACSWLARRKDRHRTGTLLSLAGLGMTLGAAYLGGHLSFTKGVGVNHTAFQRSVNTWTDVAADDDVTEGQLLRVTAKNVPVVLARNEGHLHALSATCSHAGGPLDQGRIEDGCIVCPWHQSKFKLNDGAPARGPAGSAQPVWQVKTEDGRVLIRSA